MVQFGPKNRKIPVPKRHGVRDPLKQLADREAALKDKINNPPKERDVQEVSNRFKRFMAIANEANEPRKWTKRKKEKSKITIGNTTLRKHPMETEELFLKRAAKTQRDREVEANLGSKFGVEIERNETTGSIRIIKRKGIKEDKMLKDIADEKLGKSSKRKKMAAVASKERITETKAQKKQKAMELEREEEELLLKEYQYENVPFGEVVKEPPTLNTIPRKATRNGVARPGNKGLLLSSLLTTNNTVEEDEPAPKQSKKKKAKEPKVDLKGKRKKLPLATRMKIEREQQSVIEKYRQWKKTAKA